MPDQTSSVGRHVVTVRGGLVLIRLHGDFLLPDMVLFYGMLEDICRQHGAIDLIADLRHSGTITADARRYSIQAGRGLQFATSVMFGVNPVMRVLLTMLSRAATLLRPRDNFPTLRFLASEEEARAFIALEQSRRAPYHPASG